MDEARPRGDGAETGDGRPKRKRNPSKQASSLQERLVSLAKGRWSAQRWSLANPDSLLDVGISVPHRLRLITRRAKGCSGTDCRASCDTGGCRSRPSPTAAVSAASVIATAGPSRPAAVPTRPHSRMNVCGANSARPVTTSTACVCTVGNQCCCSSEQAES
jgi:hypothetical protein